MRGVAALEAGDTLSIRGGVYIEHVSLAGVVPVAESADAASAVLADVAAG
jgi:hypothetical protein